MNKGNPDNYLGGLNDHLMIKMAEYEDDVELRKCRDFLRERRYRLADTGVSSRNLHHWFDGLLLDESFNRNGWHFFSFVEIIWLEVIKTCRRFGLSLDDIFNLKRKIFVWDSEKERHPVFEFYISHAMLSDDDVIIVITENGSGIGTLQDVNMSRLINGPFSHICVSLKSILIGMGIKVVPIGSMLKLNTQEQQLIYSLRNEDVNAINLKLKDGNIKEVESVLTTDNPAKIKDIESSLKEKGVYGSVIKQFENGVPSSLQLRRKKRL